MKTKIIFSFGALLLLTYSFAHQKYSINESWKFVKSEKGINEISFLDAPNVHLPHTWNAEDAFYTHTKMYKGAGWYAKSLPLKPRKDKAYFLHFEGALQYAEVYINGTLAGSHKGGYTAFTVPFNGHIKNTDLQKITVKVDNSPANDIAPLSGDFTRYGGLYREVYVIEAPLTRFQLNTLGGIGVKQQCINVSEKQATVEVNYTLSNDANTKTSVTLLTEVVDYTGQTIAKNVKNLTLPPATDFKETVQLKVSNPILWNTDNPYLYTVIHKLIAGKNQVIDEYAFPLGFRWFSVDAKKGFFLNGKPLKLTGTCRHQDAATKANALENYHHLQDVALAKEMGMNFMRLSHYPHDPALLFECDKKGILVWEETPIVDIIDTSAAFKQHCKTILAEMIDQHYNHTSVVMWGFMNEILLGIDRYLKDETLKKATFEQTPILATELHNYCKSINPLRLTTIAHHGDINLYEKWGLNTLTDVIGYNCYPGWYGGSTSGFSQMVDYFHQLHPEKPLFISEYGAGSDARVHAIAPIPFDFSMEYQPLFIRDYLNTIDSRPWIMGSTAWLLNDFGSEIRDESMPRINNKGLVFMNRNKKDVFYLYKARYNQTEPTLYIAARDWPKRVVTTLSQPVEIVIYSSFDKINVRINNTLEKEVQINGGRGVFTFSGIAGKITLFAYAGKFVDACSIEVEKQKFPHEQGFESIYMNLGTHATYHTPQNGPVWIAEMPYSVAGFGYIGGEQVTYGERVGTTVDIKNTPNDPLHQTARKNIEKLRMRLQPGTYEAEVTFVYYGERKNILNDIGEKSTAQVTHLSDFTCTLNNNTVLQTTDFVKEYDLFNMVTKQVTFTVTKAEEVDLVWQLRNGSVYVSSVSLVKKW